LTSVHGHQVTISFVAALTADTDALLSTVCVASVRDFDDRDGDHLVVDSVDDPVLPAASAAKAGQPTVDGAVCGRRSSDTGSRSSF